MANKISHEKKATSQSDKELIRLQKAVDASGEAIFMTDLNGIIIYINPEFTRLYGYAPEEVIGKVTPRIIKSGTMSADIYDGFWKTLLDKQIVKGELINKTKDGRLITIDGSANAICDEQDNIMGFLGIQRDITERKLVDESLLRAKERLNAFINSATDAFTIWDSELNLVELNQSALKYLPPGVEKKDLIGKNLRVLEPTAKGSGRLEQFLNVIRTGKPFSTDELALNLWSGNALSEVYLNIKAFKVGEGLGIMTTDVTARKLAEKELKKAMEELGKISVTDELTGLYNRRGFMMLAAQQLKISERNYHPSAVIFIDMDNLKGINDVFSHAAGDQALQTLASAIKETFRKGDIASRFGGDEFVILTLETPEYQVEALIKRLRDNLDAANAKNEKGYKITVSLGTAICKVPCSLESILKDADNLMYLDKTKKKNNKA